MTNAYQIDSAHSNVQFSVRHLMISNVRGVFSGVQGTVTYDPANLAELTVKAEIDANTISTQDEKRDAHLKSPDFLDVAQFPTITFQSTKVEGSGDHMKITGDLTIHGKTRRETLIVEEISQESKDPWGNTRIGASARAKIKRSDFGLNWNAALEAGGFVVGDELKLELEVELVKVQAATA